MRSVTAKRREGPTAPVILVNEPALDLPDRPASIRHASAPPVGPSGGAPSSFARPTPWDLREVNVPYQSPAPRPNAIGQVQTRVLVKESGKAWFGSALLVRGFAENTFAELNGDFCNLRVKLGQIIGTCFLNPVGRVVDDPARIHERASARL